MALETEIKTYEGLLATLRREHGAVWAVVSGDQLKATFKEFEQAATYAVNTLGDVDYLIRHTHEHRAHIPFIAVDA